MSVRAPLHAVLAIYARETGQGMIFADDDVDAPGPGTGPAAGATDGNGPGDDDPKPTAPADGRRARLKIVK
jgi:stringent starvation protein B